MQYVRSLSGSVSKTWNSINPATLSGAIDVIVVEQEDGSLACSPFHVRFGKFSLLRPYEKKVEFKVNGVKQDYPMKLGEGGEAFFVFETASSIPEALQTSPLVSPAGSPQMQGTGTNTPTLADPEPLDLEATTITGNETARAKSEAALPTPLGHTRAQSDVGATPTLGPSDNASKRPQSGDWTGHGPAHLERAATDDQLPAAKAALDKAFKSSEPFSTTQRPPSPLRTRTDQTNRSTRSTSPMPLTTEEAVSRAINLSKRLWTSNIPSQVTEKGDLMLDMTGYKSSDDEALRAEVIARKILSEELEDSYDIGSLIGVDEKGNLWIYSSEEAKEQAGRKAADGLHSLQTAAYASTDALSDPGYHSDDARSESSVPSSTGATHFRRDSDSAVGMNSPSSDAQPATAGDPNRNYAKTLRLTSEQLKALNLKPGQNSMSFSVNRATCTASMFLWRYDIPIVISDIDGTITKSDALGHVLNMIGRDWTHLGVAKLYTEIAANGYNLLYLTSRSVGQADTTRAYLAGVVQEGFKLPKGPVIMSPDRTIAALRREIYLRKPEVFKMACLRDIMTLFTGSGGNNAASTAPREGLVGSSRGKGGSPFYAGFGNRFTDALSYRSVNIPSTRIFTINSNAEVSLDLLSLGNYKTGYTSMREIVDHYFPPVGLLVKGGGEEYTDFNYWRERPLDLDEFSGSSSDEADARTVAEEDDDDDEEAGDGDRLSRTATTATARTEATFTDDDEGGLESHMDDSFMTEYRDENGEGLEGEELFQSVIESVEGDPAHYLEEDAAGELLRPGGEVDAIDAGDEGEEDGDDELEDEDGDGDEVGVDQQTPMPETADDELRADLKDLAKVLSRDQRGGSSEAREVDEVR